jgi:GBP family porin
MPTLRRLPSATFFALSASPFITAALATLPLLMSASAQAQTSVTMYGIVDAGFVSEHGGVAGAVNKLTSGVGSISRLGFRGTEDLGGGMSALFVLESGLKLDTGEQDVAGSIFNRQAFVGLKNPFGTFTLGRQYTSYYTTLVNVADPFGGGYAGTAKNLFPTVGNNTRTSNTLMLASPVIAGFSGELSYALGEQAGSNKNQRQFGAAIGYANGPATIRLAYLNKNNDAAAVPSAGATPAVAAVNRDLGTNTLLAGNYDFGVAKAFLAYGLDRGFNSAVLPNTGNPFGGVRPTASTDSTDLLAGVSVPFGATTLLASYTRKNDRTALNQDATEWAVGGLYALSKRTSLYASYARIDNKNGAGYTVGNNAEVGSGNRAINAGVRHTF